MKRVAALVKIALAAFLLSVSIASSSDGEVVEAGSASHRVSFLFADGAKKHFDVEFAGDSETRAQGLMFRRQMAPESGMVFDFEASRQVMMWMKNTFIPLDMVFITQSGRIDRIAENTTPLSEKIVASRGLVRFVLELNAGEAGEFSLHEAKRVVIEKIGK